VFEIIAIIAVVLAVAIAIVLILAAAKPDTFSVQPWENKDPAMKRTYSGAESGKGAVYAWDGNKNVGSGRMEILDASSPSKIVIKLDFFKPFEAHNTAEFTMLPQGDTATTNINWVLHGPASFMSKVMQVFMNIDSMVGKDFETGLANLKTLTEK
jgi:hypothetical protein